MGGAASSGRNNDELVEYLLDTGYIRKKEVELVFRAVDRADYILPSQRERTYKDHAWKHGNLHLSAPCIYGVAMEYLALRPGQSFLNIGSGTGYFSTMAGLLLGPYGVNHGVELHEDCLQYALERLEHFKQNSQAIEEFEFCEPSFVQGNCLRVEPAKEYDAVYCGAGVQQNNVAAVKRFVKVGGVVVMPYMGSLCRFTRVSESVWACKKALGVSFATLVIPDPSEQSFVSLPDTGPLSLQELCRARARDILRRNIWIDNPELKQRNLSAPNRETRPVPSVDESDDWVSNEENEEEEEEEEEEDDDGDGDEATDAEFIGRTRFLFNMEVDSNDPVNNPLYLRQVAMLVQHRNVLEQHRDGLETLDRITEERTDGETATSREPNGPRRTDASARRTIPGPDCSSDESSGRNCGQADRERVRRSEERRARFKDSSSDSDSDTGSEQKSLPKLTRLEPLPEPDNRFAELLDDANPPVPNPEQQSYYETDEGMDVDISNIALRDTFQRVWAERAENSTRNEPSVENPTLAKNSAENRLFVDSMKEKIRLLPLPTTLKLYVNHNRKL